MFKTFLNRRAFLIGGATSLTLPSLAYAQDGPDDVALILVGASWCAVCKQAAPMLAVFADRFQLPVLVASADEKPIAPFERFVPAAGHAIAASVNRFPTTMIYSGQADQLVYAVEGYRNATWYLGQLRAGVVQAGGKRNG